MTLSIFECPEHAEQIMKIAENSKGSIAKQRLNIMGKGLLGLGAGAATGVGASVLAAKLYETQKGHPIPQSFLLRAAPFVAGAMGMAYGIHKAHEKEELDSVRED